MDEPFIHLAGVKKVYRTRKAEFLAVSEVSFDVAAGELVALVGGTRLEIAGLIEDIVRGQQRLVMATDDPTLANQGHGVPQVAPNRIGITFGIPD